MQDEALMRQVAQGDQAAFSTLYDRHAPVVLGVLIKIVHNRALGEEILQETFWRVWDKAASFDPAQGKFTTWLFSIARRLAIDTLRRQKVRPAAADSAAEALQMERASAEGSVSDDADRRIRRDAVRQALGQLPPEQRTVLELAYFAGMTRREIADETATPLGTVHTRARLGLRHLQDALAEHGWEEAQ